MNHREPKQGKWSETLPPPRDCNRDERRTEVGYLSSPRATVFEGIFNDGKARQVGRSGVRRPGRLVPPLATFPEGGKRSQP